jgi:hypothetical protein
VEAEHTVFLHNCETHWSSRVKVLYGIFELKEEMTISLSDSSNNDNANLFYNEDLFRNWAIW